jgi:hypothetical protein
MIFKNINISILIFLFLAQPLMADEKTDSKSAGKPDKHPTTMSVEDLGFVDTDIKSDPQYQSDLQTRSDMLQIHQTLGLITAIPLTTEYVAGLVTAGNVAKGSTDTGFHAVLGISTVALYTTTAMFAILAPKPKGLTPSGNTQAHVDLAFIHAPLMVAVPVLGAIINNKVQNHQSIGSLGTIHGILATALVVSYLSSVVVISF